jgi:AraC-like DNA-binding protein
LLRRRIEVAKGPLLSTGMSLTDIGLACGFAHQSHFTRAFCREIAMTPGSWRRKITNNSH